MQMNSSGLNMVFDTRSDWSATKLLIRNMEFSVLDPKNKMIRGKALLNDKAPTRGLAGKKNPWTVQPLGPLTHSSILSAKLFWGRAFPRCNYEENFSVLLGSLYVDLPTNTSNHTKSTTHCTKALIRE